LKRDDIKFLTSVIAGYLATFIVSKLFTPVSTDIDESRPRIMDVGHNIGPLYHLDVNGVIWNFEILSYNGPPDLQHKWIYTFSMAEGMLGPNACEILIEWPAGEEPFFSVTNQGHTVHKFNLGINVGHHYSAAAVVDFTRDNKTVLFELRDLTTGEVERWADPNHKIWHLRKVVGMSPEYHAVNYCVGNECNNISFSAPFPDPFLIRVSELLFITSSGIKSIPCTTPECIYNSNWQRECLTQKKGTLCRSSYQNNCWDQYGSRIRCPKT
jgi:hypothetical protein